MTVLLKNNVSSTLATAISPTDTGIVVASGSRFPTITSGDYFYVTLVSQAGQTEIVKVTARVGNSMTVVRAQDGSLATSFQVGTLVDMRVNVASIADLRDEATEITIADAGGYYTSGTVEGALQEAMTRANLAASAGSSLVGYNQGGTGAVTRTVQSRLRDFVSVKDFGAVGDGVANDTAAIQAALAYAEVLGGRTVYVPTGTYLISATIKLGRYNTLEGETRYGSIIKAATTTFAAIEFVGIAQTNGISATVKNIFVRDADVGIKNTGVVGYYGVIDSCQIAYNRIGIQQFDSYINTIRGNLIQFNGCGIVMRGQSYQVNIVENIVDNNIGGLGIYLRGSNGCVIRDNTIEGNRNVTTKIGGCGIMLTGFNQRTLVEGNWFEINCPTPGDGASVTNQYIGADVIIGNPPDSFTASIIANCVPTEYQAEATADSLGITGGVTFNNNFHYVSKYGYYINSRMTTATVNIEQDVFVGVLGLNNKAVWITGISNVNTNINTRYLSVVNTGSSAVNAEMNSGIKRLPIFVDGVTLTYNQLKYNDLDIYTAELTMKQFSALTGSSLAISAIQATSGTAKIMNGAIRAANGVSGFRTTIGTGRCRIRVDGNPLFPSTGNYYVCVLGDPSGQIGYISGGVNTALSVMDSSGFFTLNAVSVSSQEGTPFTGSYWGALVMTTTQHDALDTLYLVKRIKIVDVDTIAEPMKSASIPTSFSSAANWLWDQGDVVYNTAPAAGGSIGWVCTASGTGATSVWNTFGAIAP